MAATILKCNKNHPLITQKSKESNLRPYRCTLYNIGSAFHTASLLPHFQSPYSKRIVKLGNHAALWSHWPNKNVFSGYTSNALMSLMSGKEMRFQVPPKTFSLDGWIKQQIGQ